MKIKPPEYNDPLLSRTEDEAFRGSQLLRSFLRNLPLPSPQEIFTKLEQLGYHGQAAQRRAVSLMAYRHVKRLKRLHVDGEPLRKLPPKQNVLMIGPTGCGKTFLVELLFQHIFRLPTVIVDITSFTESGYVGDDVRTILTRLISASGDDSELASCGVICLDEFDKLSASGSNARFAGQGTTKDVSGYGVQRELLAMLEGTEVMVPMDYGYSAYGQRTELSTRNIPFIACGAFSGFEELLKTNRTAIGFQSSEGVGTELTLDEVGSFQKYGFLPELIGRFSRVVNFPPLPPETLRQILIENLLPQFINEFQAEGLQLTFTEAAFSHLIHRSLKRGTGARGLHTELVAAVEQVAFNTFGQITEAEVIISANGGTITSDIKRVAKP